MQVGIKGVAEATAALDAMIADLRARYTMELSGMPTELAERLLRFDAGTSRIPARPVLTQSGELQRRMVEAMTLRARADIASKGRPNILMALQAGARAAREVWTERLQTNGGDVPLAPLAPRYLAWKVRRGLDPRTGIATGAMLAALQRAQVIVRKK